MLPIDTGMNRIGTHAKDLPAFLEKLKKISPPAYSWVVYPLGNS